MNVGCLSTDELVSCLRHEPGLTIPMGPFVTRIHTTLERVIEGIRLLYADYTLANETEFVDFHVRLAQPNGLRRWFRPQVSFSFDHMVPFKPLPLDQAFPMLEWGLNWCIASNANQYLLIHAAVIEKNGYAAIMPAPPGSGKSTLCAGLVNRGWRLLSDELALVSRGDLTAVPLPRPVSLKDASIDVIRRFAPDAVIGREARDTLKGTVAHMRPPADSVRRAKESAMPAWVIFPRFEAGAPARLEVDSKARAFMQVAENAFNYSVLGAEGFRVLGELIDRCSCYSFSYGNLDEAVSVFDSLQPPG